MSQLPIRIIFGKEIIRLAEEYGYYANCKFKLDTQR